MGAGGGLVPSYLVPQVQRTAALGTLAVYSALHLEYGLPAEIKWPNDVLVGRRKLCGVLAETSWQGERPLGSHPGNRYQYCTHPVPPEDALSFSATCVEQALGRPVERERLLRITLAQLLVLAGTPGSSRTSSRPGKREWHVRGETVRLLREAQPPLEGVLSGLAPDGSLRSGDPGWRAAHLTGRRGVPAPG